MEEFGEIFTEHASKLVEVSNLACSMSNNEDGVKMVRYAAAQIETLCPQVYTYVLYVLHLVMSLGNRRFLFFLSGNLTVHYRLKKHL